MLRRDLETPACKKKNVLFFFQIGSSFVVPGWINGVFVETFKEKHYLYSQQFGSTFISRQQTMLIHTRRLHHQSNCSAGESWLTLFSETIHSLQTAMFFWYIAASI